MELPHFADLLGHQLEGIVKLSPSQVSSLHSHFELLLKWNQRINLTSVRSPEEIISRHYCESIFFGTHLPDAPYGTRIADLGSGPGFPGVPMAVLRPDWRLTLVESHQRKAVFLRESTRGWNNVSVLAKRAESIHEQFDWVVSRAVGIEAVLEQVPQLSPRVGLLTSEGDLNQNGNRPDILWNEPVPAPWGDRRVCVYGLFHVEHDSR